MHCQEVRDLLSAYYDDELSVTLEIQVTQHVESCSQCSAELASFQSLTESTGKLHHPAPPNAIWNGVEARLNDGDVVSAKRAEESTRHKQLLWTASIAALILVAVSVGIFGRHTWLGHGHDELAADFSEYLETFQEKPGEAHLVLVNKYGGKAVDLDRAHVQLGYRPTLAEGLPDGYKMETSFVMDMPCCKCIKTICKRSDGGTLAIFEHDDEQPIWFGDHPSTQTECGGESCTLTQLDGQVAVSWQQGSRHLTIVGAQNAVEAAELVTHFAIYD